MPPPLHTLKIWGAEVYSPRSYGAEFVGFLSVCFFLFVRHATMLGTESLHGIIRIRIELGGTGISPPDSFSFRFRFRSSSTTNGDIFYCSGSRQLSHSSFHFSVTCEWPPFHRRGSIIANFASAAWHY